jgi:hypothetical protein
MAKFIVDGVGEFPMDLDIANITLDEAISLERETGEKLDNLIARFDQADLLGRVSFLWLSMRRAGHVVPFKRMIAETKASQVRLDWEEPTPDPGQPPLPDSGGEASEPAAATG